MNRPANNHPDLFLAKRARNKGMAQARNNAEATEPGWTDAAYEFLLSFARRNEHFISESVSGASKDHARFCQPPTDRAWGSVYRRAVRDGIIVLDGVGRSARRHASICPRWRSLVYAP